MRKIFLMLLTITLGVITHAQEITGVVVDQNGTPVVGANVQAKKSNTYTATDFDGNFSIKAVAGEDLEFSMIGMQTLVVKATKEKMNVVMTEAVSTLDEVVVVGYGTRKLTDATMAVAKVKADELGARKLMDPSQSIQGKLAGVTVVGSDLPGSETKVIIRGISSITGDNVPLFIVDGVRLDNINNLNPNDIETYEVLKDASAKSIYGNEAASGVIMITTKKSKGDMKVSVDSYVGIRQPLKMVKMAGSNLYSYYSNYANGDVLFSQDQPYNTNWFKEIMRTGVYNSNDISLSGSSDKYQYVFSANKFGENTILKGYDYGRTIARLFNEYKYNDKLKLNATFNVGFTTTKPKSLSAFTNAYKQSPIIPVRFPDGNYGVPFYGSDGFAAIEGSQINNVGIPTIDLDFQHEKSKNVNFIGNIGLEYKIFDFLKWNSSFGGEVNNWKKYVFSPTEDIYLAYHPTQTYVDAQINLLKKERSDSYRWNFFNYLTFNKTFGEHDLELMLGIEQTSKNYSEYLSAQRSNIDPATENYWALNFATSNDEDEIKNYFENENRTLSYFGRIQYKYKDRYLLTTNIRRDGSSQFSIKNRWDYFPSVGLGWIITNEDFFKDVKGLNFVKLRGSWGLTGNQDVKLNTQNFNTNPDASLGGDVVYPGTTISVLADPNLNWEVTREVSGGVDFEMFNNRLKGSFDYYDKLNRNAVLETSAIGTAGLDGTAYAHIGEVLNNGFEVALSWNNIINDNLKYRVSANYANNHNELKSINSSIVTQTGGGLGNGQFTKVINDDAVGRPVGSFWLWEYAGLDDSGEMLYYTADGDKVLQDALVSSDRKFMGSAIPISTYGIELAITYKNFDFSISGYGTDGSKVYNGKKAQRWTNENVEYSVASDFWTTSNTDAANPAPFNYVPVASSFYLESGNFFRVNNINLAYNFPNIGKIVKGGKIYVNAINPFIFQKFSGFSPEINGDFMGLMGIELDSYPTLSSYVMGLRIDF